MDISIINKNFRIVYQEKRSEGEPRARYFVGGWQIASLCRRSKCQQMLSKGFGDLRRQNRV